MTPEKGNSEEANMIQLEEVGRGGGGRGVRQTRYDGKLATGQNHWVTFLHAS